MNNTFATVQTAVNDTASVMQQYADKWEGPVQANQASAFIQTMSSHGLIYVVLAVTLIIWFVLLFYIIRTDRKVSKLEESLIQQSNQENET